MLTTGAILLVAFGYMGLLFAVADLADRRAAQGRSIISNPTIYALSLAVYCTAWTFYGSVGRAAAGGLDFLPTYIGPTLLCALGWVVLRKIARIRLVESELRPPGSRAREGDIHRFLEPKRDRVPGGLFAPGRSASATNLLGLDG